MNLDQAMKNPARTFGIPEAVCKSEELTREQKRAVLLQWKQQLQQEQAADNENMLAEGTAAGSAEVLQQVSAALLQLDS